MVTLYSGHIQGSPQTVDATGAAVLDRDIAMVYVGTFQSMDGEVEITAEHLHKLAKNHNARLDRLSLEGVETPMRDLPPIQLDHTTSAKDTIGRVVGKLRVETIDINKDGKPVPTLLGKGRFIGAENCTKASDGRWTNVSIGADLEEGVLKELSVTPFPAAPNASLLSAAKQGNNMPMPDEMKKRCRKYLTEEKKMSEEDADKKMAALSDEDAKKLSEEVDEDEKKKKLAAEDEEEKKKLAAEEEEKKKLARAADDDAEDKKDKKELSAKKAKITSLMAAATESVRLAKLEARRGTVTTRLSRLRAEQRITPAEEKNLQDLKLAEASDEAMELAFKVLESREPVVHVGQLGSVKVLDLSSAGGAMKQARLSELEADMKANMPFTSTMLKGSSGEGVAQLSTARDPVPQPQPAPVDTEDHAAAQQRIAALEGQLVHMSKTLETLSELIAS